MSIRKMKPKKLKESSDENLYINLEGMDVYCDFPYPDDGATFRTKILEIILDGDVVNPDGDLDDKDLEDILSRVKTLVVTESERKKRSSAKRLFGKPLRENNRGNLMSFSEFLKRNKN